MTKKSLLQVVGVASLGVGLMACSGSEPDAPYAPPAVVFDYRQVVAAQDVSGLGAGTYAVEVDVYAEVSRGWTSEAEESVLEAIKVLHVDSKAPAETRITFNPLDNQANARRVHLEMDLMAEGSFIVMFNMQAAHADPKLISQYNVRDPETLLSKADYAWIHPGHMLRTVGFCNHVHKIIHDADDDGVLRFVRFQFSEDLDSQWMQGQFMIDMEGPEGQPLGSVSPAQITLMGGNVIEIPIPEAAPEVTVMKFSMTGLPRFAGSFADLLSCAEQDGAVAFGYTFGSQKDAEYVVSPLLEARYRALGEDAK